MLRVLKCEESCGAKRQPTGSSQGCEGPMREATHAKCRIVVLAMQVAALQLTATATVVSTVDVHSGRETSSFSVPFATHQVH